MRAAPGGILLCTLLFDNDECAGSAKCEDRSACDNIPYNGTVIGCLLTGFPEVADSAVVEFQIAVFHSLPIAEAVLAGSGNYLADLQHLAAIHAEGVAGVTGNTTGSGLVVTNLGVFVGAGFLRGAAGGDGQIFGSFLAEELPCQFGIVDKYVAVALDGINHFVTTHFPGVHRVEGTPFQQHINALEYIGDTGLISVGNKGMVEMLKDEFTNYHYGSDKEDE